jgi:hypothetical protein
VKTVGRKAYAKDGKTYTQLIVRNDGNDEASMGCEFGMICA